MKTQKENGKMAKVNMSGAKTLPVEMIQAAGANVHARERRDSETMRGLVESIRANGLIHRIMVRPDAGGKFVIIDGHRRFEAAKIAGMKEVPVEVRDTSEDASIQITVAANVQRVDNDPLLEADAIGRMLASGMTAAEAAAAIGKSEGFVTRRARLMSLTQPWRKFARRVPCTTDMLERVAAHEPQLQDRIAAEVGLGEYEAGEGVCAWEEFSDTFRRSRRLLSEAAFDVAACQVCPNNTACHRWLFPEMENDGDAACQDAACYARRNNEAVDDQVARLSRKGTPAVEVANKWSVPDYWDASEKPNRKHPQAYVWMDGELKRIAWSVPKPEAPQKPALTPEERAARKEERRKAALVQSARDKIRKLLQADDESGRKALFGTGTGPAAFRVIADRRLERDLAASWISEELCDDLMRELPALDALREGLEADEIEAYGGELESLG